MHLHFDEQGVKKYQRDHSLRQRDERIDDSAEIHNIKEPEPKPKIAEKIAENGASVKQVSEFQSESLQYRKLHN